MAEGEDVPGPQIEGDLEPKLFRIPIPHFHSAIRGPRVDKAKGGIGWKSLFQGLFIMRVGRRPERRFGAIIDPLTVPRFPFGFL